jgi:hypothetical protein
VSEYTFFDGYAREDVSIRGVPAKSPLFYRSLRMMGATFSADLSKVWAALPHHLRPLSPAPGRALVAVHCMEYEDTDIAPYNEVALSIGLRRGWLPFTSIPQTLRALASQSFHAYVKALPVTTEVALHGGIDFFNYPKYLADISFRETASHRICTVRDKDSRDLILEFEGRRIETRACAPRDENRLTLFTYPELGGRPHRAKLLINQIERGAALGRGASLRFGPHPRAADFKELGLGAALHYVYVPRGQAILFKPEAL